MNYMLPWVVLLSLLNMVGNPGLAAEPNLGKSYADRIESRAAFPGPVLWVGGGPPDPGESRVVWEIIKEMGREGLEVAMPQLENFVRRHPASVWTPSLRAALAQEYRTQGRFSRALAHWEAAWPALRGLGEGEGKRVRDYALAHWMRLLACLGHTGRMRELLEENGEDPLDGGPLFQLYDRSREAYAVMVKYPQRSFRCGPLALANVARALGVSPEGYAGLLRLNAPVTGYPMSTLAALAKNLDLGLMAVRRDHGNRLVAPCILHWKQNHYAALLEIKGSQGFVVDPTFEMAVWMKLDAINEEASGNFLVPAAKTPGGWRRLTPAEASQVIGRSNPNIQGDDGDESCPAEEDADTRESDDNSPATRNHPESGDSCEPECPPGRTGAGAGGSGGSNAGCRTGRCSPGRGMGLPVWHVSEPFATLWITDSPVYYTLASGKRMKFTLSYKQRNTRLYNHAFNLGPLWEASFLSCVQIDFPGDDHCTLWVPGGGRRRYLPDGVSRHRASGSVMHYDAARDAYVVEFPGGARNTYQKRQVLDNQRRYYFLTEQMDRYGRATRYHYTTNSRGLCLLEKVSDPDGRETTFEYASDTSGRIRRIRAPYQRTAVLEYESNAPHHLKSITDAAGIKTTFTYRPDGFLARMTTPYGATDFETATRYHPDDPESLVRAVFVTHPAANPAWPDAERDEELFLYRPDSLHLSPVDYANSPALIPMHYPAAEVPETAPFFSNTFCNKNMHERNSFHWAPQQYLRLNPQFQVSRNLEDLTREDYRVAHLKNWLNAWDEELNMPAAALTDTLNMERRPSLEPENQIPGQTIWYDYEGRNPHYGLYCQGRFSRPLFRAWVVPDPDGTPGEYSAFVRTERNALGRITRRIAVYSGVNGEPAVHKTTYVYDSRHPADLLRTLNDRNEVTEEYFYDDDRRVNRHRLYHQPGKYYETTYTYDTHGRLRQRTTPTGLTTTFTYGTNTQSPDYGRLIRCVDSPGNRTETWTYRNGTVRTHNDARGLRLTYTRDALDRKSQILYPDGSTQQYSYLDARHVPSLDPVAVTDRYGRTTTFVYDGLRRLAVRIDPKGNRTEYFYCACGGPEQIVYGAETEAERTAVFAYDLHGNRTAAGYYDYQAERVIDSRTWKYDGLGRLVESRAPGLPVQTYHYNLQGNLIALEAEGELLHQSWYDANGNPVETTDAEGTTTVNRFDFLGRLTRREGPDGAVDTYQYGPAGILVHRNPLGHSARYSYDAQGHLVQYVNPDSESVAWHYNAAGDQVSYTDARGRTTRWDYDAEGQMIRKTNAANTAVLRYYYYKGRRIRRWTKAKGTTIYLYDANANLITVNYLSVTPDIHFKYDSLNRLTSMTDGSGTTTFSYHDNGRLLSEDGPWSGTTDRVTYRYDHAQRRTALTIHHPSGQRQYRYLYQDPLGRLSHIRAPEGTYRFTAYHHNGTLVHERLLPNGARIINDYNHQAQLTDTRLEDPNQHILNRHRYRYNAHDQCTSHSIDAIRNATLQYDYTYRYDASGQLTGAENRAGSPALAYRYDPAGNLTRRTLDNTTEFFFVNSLNQINASPLGRGTYDANGNLVQLGTSGAWPIFTYDAEDQLVEAEFFTQYPDWKKRHVWTYDGLGRMRQVETIVLYRNSLYQRSVTRFLYDHRSVIQERDAQNNPVASYTRGPDRSGTWQGAGGIGGLLARVDAVGRPAYYHADGNGNISVLINNRREIVAAYRYDPFGFLLATTGPLAEDNPYRFSSKRHFPEINLYGYGFRYYHPDLQRWIQPDPLEERADSNLYRFVRNNPISNVDHWGWFGTAYQKHVQDLRNRQRESKRQAECRCRDSGGHMGTRAELLGYGSVSECSKKLYAGMLSDNVLMGMGLAGLGTFSGESAVTIGTTTIGTVAAPATAVAALVGSVGQIAAFAAFCAADECIIP